MPAVKIACCLLLAASWPAHADLYRWVDAETGSVKFSNFPPSEAAAGKKPLQVEVIPYGTPRAAASPQQAAALPVAAVPVASAPAAAVAAAQPQAAQDLLGSLQERWRTLRNAFAVVPPKADFDRAGGAIQSQVEAYRTVAAELDRLDPAGAARRRQEEGGMFENFIKGIGAHLSSGAPQAPAAPARK